MAKAELLHLGLFDIPSPSNTKMPEPDKTSRGRWRMRLYLFAVGVKRHLTLGTRAMLIDGNRIYLVRHTYVRGWHMPGGGVEPGESAMASIGREVFEESGLRLSGPPELFGLYHSTLATNRDHVALYLCRQFEQGAPFAANFEIAEFGWFAIDGLPDGTTEPTRRRIAEVFDGVERREGW
jgi:ADP-ribose pyrophosphatase YjhB (NUDIX family)